MTSMRDPVTFFPTCLVETIRPQTGVAAVAVLRRDGHPVSLSRGATCCGQPAWNAGYADEARQVARRTLEALDATDGWIVVPSGSCATMMHEYWPVLFKGSADDDRARRVAARIREFSSYVADDHVRVDTTDDTPRPVRSVAYHDSCHMLRELEVKGQPRALLAEVGVEVEEIAGAERCCGFGGTFSVKLPGVSLAMADEKLDEIAETGVEELVGCDVSCLMHLEGRATRRGQDLRVRHLAEVLDEEG